MNYEEYSRQQFESLGLDTPAARNLADKLQDDVAAEIHGVVVATFSRVVGELNTRGHNLKADDIRIGNITFRDESANGQCFLRLGCDVVISAGYSHTLTAGEAEAEIMQGL